MPGFETLAVILLIIFACADLVAGVVNDAVNFISSAIGAKVSSRKIIIGIASIGIIIGATFSDGIIEVARKGIFHPEFFSAQEAIILFTAVAITDFLLLDLYSTFGLPTSTTVSIVFEVLGSAATLAFWKLGSFAEALQVINGSSAIKIIVGIIISVGVAFAIGLVVQFITRLIFTFDYKDRLKKWGFLWTGIALTCLMFFLLLKGGKHATFMTVESKEWIAANTIFILFLSFVFFSLISYILIKRDKNILKIIVLIGTGALALAFAGNDLANFIGVSVAGVHAYLGEDLSGTLPTPTWVLLVGGAIMSVALFKSSKAKTVTSTTVNLASHEKDVIKDWHANIFARGLSQIFQSIFKLITLPIPRKIKKWITSRWERDNHHQEENSAFDLIRASVNLMVASAVISFATSQKLPLSTTYVTFMVTMGTALADGAWDKECAPSRIAGVITVVGGWFITALIGFIFAGMAVSILYFFKGYGLIIVAVVVGGLGYKLLKIHRHREAGKTL